MGEIGPEVTLWRDIKRTRKPRTCPVCEQPIPIGSAARRWTAFDAGAHVESFYTHPDCHAW